MITAKKPDLDNILFTTSETLWYLHCCYVTLRKIIKEGRVVPARVGQRNRFLKADLDYYLQAPKEILDDSS
jgi:hypothetical protein